MGASEVAEWSEAAAFGELRSLVSGPPNIRSFERMCALVDEAEELEPGLYASRWSAYLKGHLARWSARHCTVELERRGQAEVLAQAPWAELVRGVELVSFDLNDSEDVAWIAGELRERFDGSTHLGLKTTRMKKASVRRACEAGVFDGLESLTFSSCEVRTPTLEVLLARLEERQELEHLVFDACSLGSSQIRRLLETSLVPRLKTFGFPRASSFKKHASELAARASAFEVLERLELCWCGIAGAGGEALARADWPETLARVDLRGNEIRGKGIIAWIEEGRLDALFEDGEERALDLSGQSIGNKGFAALCASGRLEGIVDLSVRGCSLTSLDGLEKVEDLSSLRRLVFGGQWSTRETGAVLVDALGRTEVLEELCVSVSGLRRSFVADVIASPAGRSLQRVSFGGYGVERREYVLDLLEWERFDEVSCFLRVGLAPDDPLVEQLRGSERFGVGALTWNGLVYAELDEFYG